mmetsp:Transcript_83137/g.178231  ORF Transcript_83137/g.178231 Transcript_83137/m.178231 type:complete len:284 (+) Transcript_83137:194-1045(+)
MGSATLVNHLEFAGFLCWLLKDLGWVLLCAPLAWPAGIAALVLEIACLRLRWGTARTARLVHDVVLVIWLLGNVVWLYSELLFEPSTESGRQFFWYSGPPAPDHEKYVRGSWAARLLFALGLSILLLFYVSSAARLRTATSAPPEAESDLVGQEDWVFKLVSPEVYELVFIGPWILKDFFWTLDLLWCGLPFGIVATLLVADCFRRFHSYTFVAEFLWVLANAIWMYGELAQHDAFKAFRVAPALLLITGCVAICREHLCQSQRRDVELATEASRLLPSAKAI